MEIITSQLEGGSIENRAGESGWKKIRRRRETKYYREPHGKNRRGGRTTSRAQVIPRDWKCLRSQVSGEFRFSRNFFKLGRERLLENYLSASHPNVFKSHGAQACRVQQVLRVYDDRSLQQMLDAVEIKGAEFRPARADHQCIHTLRRRVSRLAITYRSIQARLGIAKRNRIVSSHARAFRDQRLSQLYGR